MPTVEIVVRGHVQGVGFRWALRREAERRGVTGWVRNRRDGAVEARITGEETDVDAVVAWARHGPPLAHVERVDATRVEAGDGADGPGFEIRASV